MSGGTCLNPLTRRRQFFAPSQGAAAQETLLVKNEAKEVFEKLWWSGNSLVTGKSGTLLLIFKKRRKQDSGSYRLVSLIFDPGADPQGSNVQAHQDKKVI